MISEVIGSAHTVMLCRKSIASIAAKNTFTVPEYKNSAAFIGSCYDVYKITDYDGTSGAKTFNMGGRTYYQGYVFGKRDYVDGSALSLNVENINTLTFDLGHVDGSGGVFSICTKGSVHEDI